MFSRLKIRTQLMLGFSFLMVLMIVLAVFGIVRVHQVEGLLGTINDVNAAKMRQAINFRGSVHDRAISVRDLVLATTPAQVNTHVQDIETLAQAYSRAATALDQVFAADKNLTTKERDYLANIQRIERQTLPLIDQAISLARSGRSAEATTLINNQLAPVFVAWLAAINQMIDGLESVNQTLGQEVRDITASFMVVKALLTAMTILLGTIVAFVLTRSLLRQLGGELTYASDIARRIAAGDLSTTIQTAPDDTTSLVATMKGMRDSLASIVRQVNEGTHAIELASSQIADGNRDLAGRTESQAESLQSTSVTMVELTDTVKRNADSAALANTQALTASEVAIKGGEAVEKVVQTMGGINESSRKISEIISVIDGIAFQTNILALNAAVEAARAGEHGKGFAVVASEVRTLAQRSASAAKEISALISNSVQKVDEGGRLVADAGQTMQEIVDSVRRVTDIMQEIAQASQEQTTGIEQINRVISQMDSTTQQNAELVEESAAAAAAMHDQAITLSRTVARFRLADNDSRFVDAEAHWLDSDDHTSGQGRLASARRPSSFAVLPASA
ncbi:MAG: methyl-accepting chemotaxis protein [Pusillimonas sp.]